MNGSPPAFPRYRAGPRSRSSRLTACPGSASTSSTAFPALSRNRKIHRPCTINVQGHLPAMEYTVKHHGLFRPPPLVRLLGGPPGWSRSGWAGELSTKACPDAKGGEAHRQRHQNSQQRPQEDLFSETHRREIPPGSPASPPRGPSPAIRSAARAQSGHARQNAAAPAPPSQGLHRLVLIQGQQVPDHLTAAWSRPPIVPPASPWPGSR